MVIYLNHYFGGFEEDRGPIVGTVADTGQTWHAVDGTESPIIDEFGVVVPGGYGDTFAGVTLPRVAQRANLAFTVGAPSNRTFVVDTMDEENRGWTFEFTPSADATTWWRLITSEGLRVKFPDGGVPLGTQDLWLSPPTVTGSGFTLKWGGNEVAIPLDFTRHVAEDFEVRVGWLGAGELDAGLTSINIGVDDPYVPPTRTQKRPTRMTIRGDRSRPGGDPRLLGSRHRMGGSGYR